MRSWKSSETAPAAVPGDLSAQAAKEPEYLEIAQIQAPYGTDGEVRARIITDFPGRFARLKSVLVGPSVVEYALERSRVQGGEVILKLVGVDTPEAAAKTAERTTLPSSVSMQGRIDLSSLGTAIRLPDIYASNGDPCTEKPLEHPSFFWPRQPG